jgi:hypothetical protein
MRGKGTITLVEVETLQKQRQKKQTTQNNTIWINNTTCEAKRNKKSMTSSEYKG